MLLNTVVIYLVVNAAVLAGDVELKHLLWTLQQQWGTSTGAWLEAPFFELDVVDMTEQVRVTSSHNSWQHAMHCAAHASQ
jgi:hypothetical protein